jgi:hypothetical protein
MFLAAKIRATARGDAGIARCMTVELERMGNPHLLEQAVPPAMERPERDDRETADPPPMETRKGGRPKLPRCEHGQIVGRCVDCEDGAA